MIALRVENLCKSYRIAHQATGATYRTLREEMLEIPKRLLSMVRPAADGGPSGTEEFQALRNVSFDVSQGEVVGIIGRNGAGKSTLLKILSRITEPTSGRVPLYGRVASLLEVGTGFHPELTGRENIFLNGAILGMSRSEIKAKFDEIVAFAEVERFLDTPVKRYSSGMYVRLAFAVAAHLEPEILIVDEVLAVGDSGFQKKCLGKMQEVSRGGRTVLFVSHQMGAISSLCSRAILLNAGQVVSDGGVPEVVRDYLELASDDGNSYQIDPRKLSPGRNQIISIQVESVDGTPGSEFTYSQQICLTITYRLTSTPGLLLGVGLDNAMQVRVFTIMREAAEGSQTDTDGNRVARLKLPRELIAPGRYAFTVALFEHRSAIHDHVANVCPVQISDDGSPYARFEGVDYGSVIVAAEWAA
jgi:lipopolysaccharide transport system ATP-binding protein